MTLNIPQTDAKRVVIVGGGFGGLQLVKKLSRSGYQVVLVDRNNYHMFQPLLYQVATAAINPGDISFPFRKLFRGKKDIYFRMAEVQRIDPDRNKIHTDRGELGYDYLVLASGSTTNFFGMRNIEEQSYAMKEVGEALAIRNRVLLHIEKAVELGATQLREAMLNIVIVGGGATGVELAGAFAGFKNNIMPRDYPEYHRNDIRVFLVEGSPRLLGTMSEKTSRGALEYLEDKGVEVILDTTVIDYRKGSVVLKDGRTIPTRNLIWTSRVTVKLPEGLDRFEKGRGGRLVTDMYFRLKGSDNIFAVGDASVQTEDPNYPNGYPQLARVAMEQASHLGRNLVRLSKGSMPERFSYRQYPVLATVGRNHAFAEYGKFRMGGFPAWLSWAIIHLYLILGVKNKFNIFMGWIWNYVTYDLPTRVIIFPPGTDIYRPESGVVKSADSEMLSQAAMDSGRDTKETAGNKGGLNAGTAVQADVGDGRRTQAGRQPKGGGGKKIAAGTRATGTKEDNRSEGRSGKGSSRQIRTVKNTAVPGNRSIDVGVPEPEPESGVGPQDMVSATGNGPVPAELPVFDGRTGTDNIPAIARTETGRHTPERLASDDITATGKTSGNAVAGTRETLAPAAGENTGAAETTVNGTVDNLDDVTQPADTDNAGNALKDSNRQTGSDAAAGKTETDGNNIIGTPSRRSGAAAKKEKVLA